MYTELPLVVALLVVVLSFGILIIFASKVTSISRYPWKTKFEEKLTTNTLPLCGTTARGA